MKRICGSWLLAAVAAVLTAAAAGASTYDNPTALSLPSGNGPMDDFLAANVGTAGPDVLTGTPGPDIMLGLGGKDRILGGLGNDQVLGGPGKDLLRGEGGRDGLKGQRGKDTCVGGSKPDKAKACEKLKS